MYKEQKKKQHGSIIEENASHCQGATNAIFTSKRELLVLAAILLLTLAVYSGSVSNGFTNWDDGKNVYENMWIREISMRSITHWFTEPLLAMYTPLVYMSYAIDYRIGGIDPRIYHLTNLLLHLLNITLVFMVIRRLALRLEVAVFAALFFAIHPLNVGAVAPVSLRGSLLYSAFYLAAFYCYLRYLTEGYLKKYLCLSLIVFICALLSKSAAVTLPVLLLLTDYYYRRKADRSSILEKIPFFVLSLIFGILTFVFRQDAGHIGSTYVFTIIEKFFLVTYALSFYLVKLFLPVNLSPYYPYPDRIGDLLPVEYYLSPLLLIGIAGLVWRWKAYRRELLFGLSFYLIHIALVLKVIPMGGEIVCDRYMYIPGIGIMLIVGGGCIKVLKDDWNTIRSLAVGGLVCIIAAIFAFLSYFKIMVWKDSISMYDDVLSKYPNIAGIYNNRALAKAEAKDYSGALEDYNRSVSLEVSNYFAMNNRGVLKLEAKDFNGAMTDLNMSIKINPLYGDAYNNRGTLRMELKDYPGALSDFDKAIELDPKHAEAFNNRGNLYLIIGDMKRAISDFNSAIRINPFYAKAYFNRGNIRKGQKDYSGAAEDFIRAIEIAPDYAEAYNNLGVLMMEQEDYAGAIGNFNRAAALRPNDMNVYMNRGIARILTGKRDEACRDWQVAMGKGGSEAGQMLQRYCKL